MGRASGGVLRFIIIKKQEHRAKWLMWRRMSSSELARHADDVCRGSMFCIVICVSVPVELVIALLQAEINPSLAVRLGLWTACELVKRLAKLTLPAVRK